MQSRGSRSIVTPKVCVEDGAVGHCCLALLSHVGVCRCDQHFRGLVLYTARRPSEVTWAAGRHPGPAPAHYFKDQRGGDAVRCLLHPVVGSRGHEEGSVIEEQGSLLAWAA